MATKTFKTPNTVETPRPMITLLDGNVTEGNGEPDEPIGSEWVSCGMDEAFPCRVSLNFASEDAAYAYYLALHVGGLMGQKIELRTALEVLQQEIDFHNDGAPKISKPDPRYCEGFISGLKQAKELIEKVAEVEAR